jgi:hypothetical protein
LPSRKSSFFVGVEDETYVSYSIAGPSRTPPFVVMRMTPLAPRLP